MKSFKPLHVFVSIAIGSLFLVATVIFAEPGDKSSESTTTKLVSQMVQRYHIKQSGIDDEISKKLLKRYLKNLDNSKLYFLQSDIDRFNESNTILDDQILEGKTAFAHELFEVFLKRFNQQVTVAQALVDRDYDFTLDESLVIDPDTLTWAKDKSELDERWRKRIKYDLLLLKLDDVEEKVARDRLHKRYRMLKRIYNEMDNHEILEMYLSALTHCFDPHSSYMSPQTLEDFRIQMRLSLEGIGAALRSEDGYTTVAQIVPGGAADKDGRLKVGDKILAVDSGDGEMRDIVEMKLSKVVRFIRGNKGTVVKLKVKPADGGETQVYQLTRQKIELKSSAVKGEIIETKDWIPGKSLRIGVINIPSFYRDFSGAQQGAENFKSTARDTRKVLEDFKKQGGVDCVVVDIRTNGGGALTESIEVSGLFINEGPVVQVKELDGRVKAHRDEAPGVAYDGPLVVVCNRLSASASEIFAGVIKDYRRGIIIGDETTHGKGTVQNVMPVSRRLFQLFNKEDLGALKLTINQFYRVNGDSTQNRGVRSDITLPSLFDHMDLGESSLDNALAFDKIQPAEHQNYGLVNDDLISALKQSSAQRVLGDSEFQDLQKRIQRYISRKERKEFSLNEAVQRKERAEDKKESEEEKKKKEAEQNGEGPIFPKGFYNNELLHIAVDYVQKMKSSKTASK